MHHLAQAVHAGIRATGYNGLHGRLCELAQRPFELILHGFAVRLRLPATKCRTVVLDA